MEREKSLDRQIRAFQWLRMLCALPGRVAGSAGERAAAAQMAEWLGELGFERVGVRPAPGGPRTGSVAALHLGAGALGCGLGGWLGAGLAALAALSSRAEMNRGDLWLSRLLPAPGTRNVIARAGARRPRRRVVLHARLDAGTAPRISARPGRSSRRAAPYLLPAVLLPAAAGLAAADALGADAWLLGALRALVSVVLVVGAAGMLVWATAPPARGANDASGLAALLSCSEQVLALLPDDTELWVVASGAGKVGARGLRAFVAEHGDWPAETALFIDFETLGSGSLHWVRRPGAGEGEGSPLLVELARRVAAAGAYGEITGADPVHPTAARVPAVLGFPSLSLVALAPSGLPVTLRGIEDGPEHLELETIMRAADFGAAVVRAALRGEAGPIAIV